jgi:hypothetical protein
MPESKSGALPLGDAPAGRPRINQPGRGANPAKWPEGRDFCPVAGGGGHSYKGASRGEGPSFRTWLRRVAQPGRALRSGRRGRRFESSLSDHIFKHLRVEMFPTSRFVGIQWEFRVVPTRVRLRDTPTRPWLSSRRKQRGSEAVRTRWDDRGPGNGLLIRHPPRLSGLF